MAKKKAVKRMESTKERTHPVRLDLKESDYQRLEQAAKEMGCTKSAFLRILLFKYFREMEKA